MTEVMKKITADPRANARRLARGRYEAQKVIHKMAAIDIAVELIGSIKTGEAHRHSDIDLLVTDCGKHSPEEILHQIKLLERQIPIDVIFLDMLPEAARRRFKGC